MTALIRGPLEPWIKNQLNSQLSTLNHTHTPLLLTLAQLLDMRVQGLCSDNW